MYLSFRPLIPVWLFFVFVSCTWTTLHAAEYPPPFIAVARTSYTIPPFPHRLSIQTNRGSTAGFSGFVDQATGQVGFPGYRNYAPLRIAFDNDKLVLVVRFPYPYGRSTRAAVTDPKEDLLQDDAFEVLIDPRDDQGRSRGQVYRIIGNAAGICRVDKDLPSIGQFHQSWGSDVRYGTMMWDPSHNWIGGIQIPFEDLGGPPADGDTWGIQCILHYADPKITAVLSPTESLTDTTRFAHVRFDRERRANFICHWLAESEIKQGTFTVSAVTSNSGNEPVQLLEQVRLFKGDRETGSQQQLIDVKPLETYSEAPKMRIRTELASDTERNGVGRITVTDQRFNTVIYDQFVPFWRPAPGERDWLTSYFAKEFTFLTGPYPSRGLFDYELDCQTLKESIPTAQTVAITVECNGKTILNQTNDLPRNGKASGTLSVGKMPDGAEYKLTAAILGSDGKTIGTKSTSFTRTVMPFETASPVGESDIVVPPFTPPSVEGDSASVWNRTYRHGRTGLLDALVAADENILARPARFLVQTNAQSPTPALGGSVDLHRQGEGMVAYHQRFGTDNVELDISGELDYDGFYKFRVTMRPLKDSAELTSVRLEIPLRAENATLIDAVADWIGKTKGKIAGLLDTKPGRLWDSQSSPWQANIRRGNMPPYIWVGDDDRGLMFSCVSEQGMHNDDAKPALTLDREGDEVVMRVSLVNKPFTLSGPRTFEFALQASPFKPMPDRFRLWRNVSRRDPLLAAYQAHGRFFSLGWGTGGYYPSYGRYIDLAQSKAAIDRVRADGFDMVPVPASSCSESGGTPEYQQFWHEWGSPLGWNTRNLSPVPDWARDKPAIANRFCFVESLSNTSPSNLAYRLWWFEQMVRHSGAGFIYQDNPPYGYFDQPAVGYGYTRDDGVREPTSMAWNSRLFIRRVATALAEDGLTDSPYVWPNMCGAAAPGRSFCRKALTGESLESDKIPLDAFRVWFSKQWGFVVGWLMQEPTAGASTRYWRALGSRLFLHDCTNFSRWDTCDMAKRWLLALDAFWLDDPTVQWHPYYQNTTVRQTAHPTTLVSTYTAAGRALFVVSNQDTHDAVAAVTLNPNNLTHFYDAETGEAIEFHDRTLRMFIPGQDYRLVLGFPQSWPFAAAAYLNRPELPAESTLDSRLTIRALAEQLLISPRLTNIPDGHQLYAAWLGRIIKQITAEPQKFAYFDQAACATVDLGDPQIRCAMLFDRRRHALLIAYVNPTGTDRLLHGDVRAGLLKLAGYEGRMYVLDPISGAAQRNVLDLPAASGKVELIYTDGEDYWGVRHGPFTDGTWLFHLQEAVRAKSEESPSP